MIDRAPSYTRRAFDIRVMPDVVRWAKAHVKRYNIDAIVACGHSGLVIGGALAYATGIPIFAARKDDEPTVSGSAGSVSGIAPKGPAQRWLWFDDLIGSGGTLRRSAQRVYEADLVEKPHPELILLYNNRIWGDSRYLLAHPDWKRLLPTPVYVPWHSYATEVIGNDH